MFKSVQKCVLQLNEGRAVWSHKSPPILASAASPQREITQFQKRQKNLDFWWKILFPDICLPAPFNTIVTYIFFF